MTAFVRDLRIALRGLLRSPSFFASSVAILAIAIGANTALFALIHGLLWKPLPFPDSGRIVTANAVSWHDTTQWRGVEAAGAALPRTWLLADGTGSEPEVALSGMVTAGFFRALGAEPMAGRAMEAADERTGNNRSVWLSHSLWRSRYGADRRVIGQRLALNEEAYLVVGVLPESFQFPMRGNLPDLYIPLDEKLYGGEKGPRTLFGIARLAPGVPVRGALPVEVRTLDQELRGGDRGSLWLLAAAALLMLAIAVANLASLAVARAAAKSRETSIRINLGATRWQMARLDFATGLVLAVSGSAAGFALASWSLELAPFAAELFPALRGAAVIQTPSLAGWPIAFAAATAAVVAVCFGIAPLLRWTGARASFVAAEIGLGFGLLFVGTLLVRSLLAVLAVSPGFDAANVISAGIGVPESRYGTEAKMAGFHTAVMERLRAAPGVEAVAAAAPLPMTSRMRTRYDHPSNPQPRERQSAAAATIVSPDFFRLLRIPLVEGRSFNEFDRLGQPPVIVISRSLAEREFPGGSAIGQRLGASFWIGPSYPTGTAWRIVGVAADVRQRGLDQPAEPQIYFPLDQMPVEGLSYLLKTVMSPGDANRVIRSAVSAVDPLVQKPNATSFSAIVDDTWRDRRWMAAITSGFAIAGLLLAAIGVYGLIAYRVVQRTREIGVRMAIGANSWSTVKLVMLDTLRPVAIGLAVAILPAVWAARWIASLLYGVGPADPLSAIAAIAGIGLTALLASAVPAWRATRISITEALKSE